MIVSDNFHPARSGSGSLYTVEHFQAVRERLAADGVFCQWLPLHQLDNETLRSIVQSFLVAFPHGWAMLASNSLETPVLGLVGRADDGRFDVDCAPRVTSRAPPRRRTTRAHSASKTNSPCSAASSRGPRAAQRSRAAPQPTPTISRSSRIARPRITYAPATRCRAIGSSHCWAKLSDRTRRVTRHQAPDEAWPQRLAAYWAARDRFIDPSRNVRPSVGRARHARAGARAAARGPAHQSRFSDQPTIHSCAWR